MSEKGVEIDSNEAGAPAEGNSSEQAAEIPSDERIAERLREILKDADLEARS
jgi:hypothetical protein